MTFAFDVNDEIRILTNREFQNLTEGERAEIDRLIRQLDFSDFRSYAGKGGTVYSRGIVNGKIPRYLVQMNDDPNKYAYLSEETLRIVDSIRTPDVPNHTFSKEIMADRRLETFLAEAMILEVAVHGKIHLVGAEVLHGTFEVGVISVFEAGRTGGWNKVGVGSVAQLFRFGSEVDLVGVKEDFVATFIGFVPKVGQIVHVHTPF